MSEVGGLKGVIDECNGIVVANGFMASAVLLPGGKLSYKSKKSHSLDCVIYNQGKILFSSTILGRIVITYTYYLALLLYSTAMSNNVSAIGLSNDLYE